MARINIDSKFFADGRVAHLAAELDEDLWMAQIRLIHLWHHCYEQRVSVLKKKTINALCKHKNMSFGLIESELADSLDNDMIRVRGVDERIDYLLKSSASGKVGAAKRWGLDRVPHSTPIGVAMPSSSSSSSSSNSNTNTGSFKSPDGDPPIRKNKSCELFVEEFKKYYRERYQIDPVITGKTWRIAKTVINSIGEDKALGCIKTFLSIGYDPYFYSGKHNITQFMDRIDSIKHAFETGKEYATVQEMQIIERENIKRRRGRA